MNTIRIYQLAQELNLSNKELLQKLSELGLEANNHMSTLTEEEAQIIKALYAKWRKKEQVNKQEEKTAEKTKESNSDKDTRKEKSMVEKKNADFNPQKQNKNKDREDKKGGKAFKQGEKTFDKDERQQNKKDGKGKDKKFNNFMKDKDDRDDRNYGKNEKGRSGNHRNSSKSDRNELKLEIPQGKPFARQSAPNKKDIDKKERSKKYMDGPGAGKLMLEKKTHKHKKDHSKKIEKENELNEMIEQKYGKAGDGIFEIESTIVVATLAKLLDISASDIIMDLIKMGIMANINQEIKFETAEKIAEKYDVILTLKEEEEDDELDIVLEEDDEKDLVTRAPIVAVMGHVDHGKTTLLDKIRSTQVTESEAGGITQHIGASEVYVNGQKIVFLDTPGHEAFTEMRARGAQVTDIAIIVIAADDGIMPQTIEAINHVKAANVPLIIAINKIDKPTANLDKVRQELADKGVLVEAWGGDTIDVALSAKTGENVDQLLEMILLLAEVEEFKANPNRRANGTVIEANLDKGRGSVATMIVMNGTLKVGDPIVVGSAYGKVRAMLNTKGKKISKAGPASAVEITGLNEVPEAGDHFVVVENEKEARSIGEKRKAKKREDYMKSTSKIHLEDLFNQMKAGEVKELNLIVKADVQGSVEAVKGSLEKISNEEVLVRAIHGGVGAITESDIMLASASNAIIIGFNVRPTQGAVSLAEKEKVEMKLYRVIYEAIEDIEKAMKGMLAPEFEEEVLGTAEIRACMKVPSVGMIAGSYVTSGKIVRNSKVRLVREGIVVYEGAIDSLRRFKDDVKEVATGYECGIGLVNYNDIKEGDIIENYIMKEIKRG